MILTLAFLVLAFLATPVLINPAFGQEATSQAPPETGSDDKDDKPSVPSATERIAAVEQQVTDLESATLSEDDKQSLATLYQEALREWKAVHDKTSAAQENDARKSQAGTNLDAEKTKRQAEEAIAVRGVPESASLLELEQLLQERQQELDLALQEKQEFDTETEHRLRRREAIPNELKHHRDRLAEINKKLELPPPSGELADITTARRETLESRMRRLESDIRLLESEEAVYEAERLLRPVTGDIGTTRLKRLEQEFDSLQKTANIRRKNEAQSRLENARYIQRTYHDHPDQRVVKLADQNVDLAKEGLRLSQQMAEATTAVQGTEVATEQVRSSYSRLERQAAQGGAALAILMRREKSNLPDLYGHRQVMKKHQRAAGEAQNSIYALQEQRERLAIENERGAKAGNSESRDDAEQLLAEQQRDLLDENALLADKLFETLVNAAYAEQALIDQANEVRTFIDERILWLRSDKLLAGDDVKRVGGAARWLARRDHWKSYSDHLLVNMQLAPVSWSIVGILFVGIFSIRPRMRRGLDRLGTDALRGNCVTILPTVQAAILTILLAGVIPAVLAALGGFCLFTFGVKHSEFIRSIGAGLLTAAAVLWLLDSFRTCCRAKGLGPSHFFWSSRVNAIVRNTLKWTLLPAVVLSGLTAIYQIQSIDPHRSSLGRMFFIALMVITFATLRRIIHPDQGIFSEYLQRYQHGWFAKLRWLWQPILLSIPVALGVLALVGYIYTAWQLSLRLYGTVLIVLCSQLLGSLLFRWVLVHRRRLTVAMHRGRVAREKTGGDTDPESELDLVEINVQTQRLIRSGIICAAATLIVGVWADVLPAFRALDRFVIWHTTSSVAGELVGISVADFVIAIFVFIMTLIAAKNLPGLLEVAILQQLPIDSSVRYAITTMGRYVIITVGVIATASLIGIAWGNIQWLVAAMGVGLGFGLQEVVANFVCGVILMFERPIRVGDIITLGDVTGKVSRIRIRATTLIDWDGKELVVPNKDLITGRLLNWTLTDSRNRVVIEIGIAYGSDVGQARQLMLRVASAHPEVLSDPSPSVTFESFGDSALTMVLRAFLGSLDNRLSTIHELNEALHRELNEAGIEIAFPHRDLNIRSLPPLQIESGTLS